MDVSVEGRVASLPAEPASTAPFESRGDESSTKPIPITPSTPSSSSSSASRRRTPPLGRHLKRTPQRRLALIVSSPPPLDFLERPNPPRPIAGSSSESDAGTLGDVFAMGALKDALSAGPEKEMVAEKRLETLRHEKRNVTVRRKHRKARAVGILDLPDEVLLNVFSRVHDQYGFRPRMGPVWYTPPLRISLVCHRWLHLTRSIFYQTLSIHHPSRVSALSQAFTSFPHLTSHVRRVSIALPRESIDLPVTRTTDETVDNPFARRTLGEQLRALILKCECLLGIEVAGGISASALLVPPGRGIASTSCFSHLALTRLSSLASLSLSSPPSGPSLTASELSSVLISLPSLLSLHLKNYNPASRTSTSPRPLAPSTLSLSPPSHSPQGLITRPLPLRARKLRLRKLVLTDCSFTSLDLVALFGEGIERGALREVEITEIWEGRPLGTREGRDPTFAGLMDVAKRGWLQGVRKLKVGLYNYPSPSSSSSSAIVSAPPPPTTTSSHRRIVRPTRVAGTELDLAIDDLLPFLPQLEYLDLGGALATPQTLSLLPPALMILIIRACPPLTASVVLGFLQTEMGGRGLRVLEVVGEKERGWGGKEESWRVQRACWERGVRWRGW